MHVCQVAAVAAAISVVAGPLPQAAAAEGCGSLAVAQWILGTWTSVSGDRAYVETWTRLSDTTFEGKGVTTKGAARAIVDGESMRMLQMRQEVFLVSKVDHNSLPIGFELTQCSSQRLVFENPAHDFPRRIEYAAAGPGQMIVHVSDGGDKGFTLTYNRQTGAQP